MRASQPGSTTRAAGALALATALLVGGNAGPAAAAPVGTNVAPAAVSPSVATESRTTTVVLRVRRCEGCLVSATRAFLRDGAVATWSSDQRVVRDGRVRLRVPQRHTRGLYVVMHSTAPRAAHLLDAAPLLSFRYARHEVGERVSPTRAARARAGHACWRGTDRRRVVLGVDVDRWWGRNRLTGERGFEIRPYLRRGARTVGETAPAHRGTVGTQDVDPCHLTS